MRQGHFKVAEAYILYRAHRALLREAERVEEEAAAGGADQTGDEPEIEELPDATKESLTPDSLEEFVYDITAVFNDAFDIPSKIGLALAGFKFAIFNSSLI